ncbi:MAG TPA: nuclear transport factor 2 family protein, partial [Phnomibacter sp.]|nr:nuclear transport factor 2 family protein [Phnomibacter sp.]
MQKLAAACLGLMLLHACRQPPPATSAGLQNQQLVMQYFEHFNNHAWDKMAAMYADTASFKDPALGNDLVRQTRAEIAAKY